jgi:FkbM family methyltransferase
VLIAEQNHLDDLKNVLNCDDLRTVAKTGIIHVGAHEGQEVEQYLRLGFERIALIEANPKACDVLHTKFGDDTRIKIFNYAICDRAGVIDLHIHTSRSGSTEPASIFRMKRFNQIVSTLHTPRTVQVSAITLDGLFEKHGLRHAEYNHLNIDIQGAELLAFKGAIALLGSMDVVISEVNVIPLYENGPLEDEVVVFLASCGLLKRHTVYHTLYDESATFPAWGECLFVRPAGTSPVMKNIDDNEFHL